MENLLTPQEMADVLGVAVSTIYQWTHQEYIPHIKIGRFVRFRISIVEKWLEKREKKGRKTRKVAVGL
ncbi:MAG: helix-turn-helix domain-containing protein [FCB group bacterium]|nr:helix-turn-helix domain-containing protein [FCB group bacterium]